MAGTIFDKTLIPFDGSSGAELAINTLTPIAKAMDGHVHIVMVLDQYVQNELAKFGEVEHVTIDQAANIGCERVVATAIEAGLSASFKILNDVEVVEGLVAEAKAAGCSSIALPTYSMSGVTRWLTGNLRDNIVKESSLPVLVLPPAR